MKKKETTKTVSKALTTILTMHIVVDFICSLDVSHLWLKKIL